MASEYRIVRKHWPDGIVVQVRSRWRPWWRDLQNCGISEEWARKVVENHRKHGTVYEVLEP